jgi:hypothetical protein
MTTLMPSPSSSSYFLPLTLYHLINMGCFPKVDDLIVIHLQKCLLLINYMAALITETNKLIRIILFMHFYEYYRKHIHNNLTISFLKN